MLVSSQHLLYTVGIEKTSASLRDKRYGIKRHWVGFVHRRADKFTASSLVGTGACSTMDMRHKARYELVARWLRSLRRAFLPPRATMSSIKFSKLSLAPAVGSSVWTFYSLNTTYDKRCYAQRTRDCDGSATHCFLFIHSTVQAAHTSLLKIIYSPCNCSKQLSLMKKMKYEKIYTT